MVEKLKFKRYYQKIEENVTKYWEQKEKGNLKIYLMKEIVQFLILLYISKWRMDFKRTLIIEIIDIFYNNNGQNKVYWSPL